MPLDTVRAAEPRPEHFLGSGNALLGKRLFHATRPKFFPASLLPVIAGTAWGVLDSGRFDVLVFLLALSTTLCVHAGANVLNDVGDDAGGTDRLNDDRIYPYTGGSRFIQAGIMSAKNMARLGAGLLVAAMLGGLLLLSLKGLMVLWFGLAGIILAVLYSLGPLRLSSLGLGEAAVGIAFGVLPVCGAAWLQSDIVDVGVVMFSLPVSAWVTAILLINEVPDIGADAATGKRTLPVRLGLNGTATVYMLLHLFAAAITIWLSMMTAVPVLTAAVPVILLVPAYRAATAIRVGITDRQRLTKAIELTLGIHTTGAIWLTASVLFAALITQ